ncbi:TetR/AcrR family transcriptional regulator [Actinacidiphila oryziradicis]|uniref:TetR/AcrR family transcriptional regulator n=1 Tax=Actinacidiphila oryziradicis TaxID=2571141 RepID=A0A4U0SGR5_9ACTN|nr:TetR family transcriptional regulator [Actinacidiphila oryziradicis]TKA08824.1 TetR/AcrR family transcriptional regulator [Actinacidiphila oryziradicis]
MTAAPGRAATARRTELFDHLVALLLSEGFAHLTVDELASRLHCSKTTLYSLAGSREQLIRAAVVHFFREATRRVEASTATVTDPRDRLGAYLRAVAAELQPASAAFYEHLAAFPPVREVYERNTEIAARRVQQIIREGVEQGAFRDVHAAFVADVVSSAMVRIQRRQVAAATGLPDAQAYAELATMVLHGIAT